VRDPTLRRNAAAGGSCQFGQEFGEQEILQLQVGHADDGQCIEAIGFAYQPPVLQGEDTQDLAWQLSLLDARPEWVEKQALAQWLQVLGQDVVGETHCCLLLSRDLSV